MCPTGQSCCSSACVPTANTYLGSAVLNPGFETGSAGLGVTSWTVTTHINNGLSTANPTSLAALALAVGGVANTHTLVSASGPCSQQTLSMGASANLRYPRIGNQAACVNGPSTSATSTAGANQNSNTMSQTFTFPAGCANRVSFYMASVLQNPAHTPTQQPYFVVYIVDVTKSATVLFEFGSPSSQTFAAHYSSVTIAGTVIQYTPWFYFDFLVPNVKAGDQVQMNFIATGCSPSAHWSELYVDNVGQPPTETVVYARTVPSIKTGAPLSYQIYVDSPVVLSGTVTLTLDLPGTSVVSVVFLGWVCSSTSTLMTCTTNGIAANSYQTGVVTVIAPAAGTTLAPSVCLITKNLCSPIYPKTTVTS